MRKLVLLLPFIVCTCLVINVFSQNTQNKQTIKVQQQPNEDIKNVDPSLIKKFDSKMDDSNYFDGNTMVKVQGTTISIIPPKTFHFKEGSSNTFIQDWTSSSILVQQLNAGYEKMIATITPETFTKQGFKFVSKYEVFTKSGNPGMLYVISFKTGEWEYERIVLFSGDRTKTAWISANYPVIMRNLLYEVLEKCVLNIEF